MYRACGTDCSIESRVDTFTFNYTHARHPLFSLDRVPSVYNIVCNTCTVYLHSTHSRHGWSLWRKSLNDLLKHQQGDSFSEVNLCYDL